MYLARVVDGEVVVGIGHVRRLIRHRLGDRLVFSDLTAGQLSCYVAEAHATPAAALLALEERLRDEAKAEREKASEYVTRAERLLMAADRARRMAEGGR